MDSLEQLVRDALAERYRAPVVRAGPAETVQVLAGKALDHARQAVVAAGRSAELERVQPIELGALAWFAVPPGGLRLWRQHGRSGDDGELVTEVIAGDPPFQVVADWEGWHLLRLTDGATGWAPPDTIEPDVLESAAPPSARLAQVPVPADAMAREATSFLGMPYVWGGTTEAGVDCSGLVQRAAWRAGGAWLPRHSTALLRAGRRVAPSAVAMGDVLVLRRRPGARTPEDGAELPAHGGPARHPMHVAVAVDAGTAVHASRDAWQVVREPLHRLRERYTVLGVRRLDGAVD